MVTENHQQIRLSQQFSPFMSPRPKYSLLTKPGFAYCNELFLIYNFNDQMSSQKQLFLLERAKQACYARMSTEPPTFSNGLWCNRTWDGIMCWNDSPASTTVRQQCPSYIYGFAKNNFAFKKCTSSGNWYRKADTNTTWTNYTSCIDKLSTGFHDHIDRISTIINFGYGASFITLSAAIIILIFCRRFNYKSSIIHMNLFLSFCVRALFALLRQNLFTHGYAMNIDIEKKDGQLSFKQGIHWECRLLFTLFVYGVAVSQSWIFVEGVYLQMLFYRTLHTQQRGIKIYVIFGWCFPLTFLIPWVIVRLKYENVLCWNINQKIGYLWIIRGPIILLIAINFLFFIDNICILFKRTQARMKNRTARKLAKFIMMLVPLFGVPNVLFMMIPPGMNANVDTPYLYISLLYSSFQGVILAFLYCFLHEEVRLTVKQSCHRFLMRRRINLNLRSHENRSLTNRSRDSFASTRNAPLSSHFTEMNDSSFQVVEMPAVLPNNSSKQQHSVTTTSSSSSFKTLFRSKSVPVGTNALRITNLPQTDLNKCRVFNCNPSARNTVTAKVTVKGDQTATK